MHFESFIEKTSRATTPDSLFDILREALDREGYDKVLFAILTPHHEIGLKPGIGIIQNYPTDWMGYYFAQRLDQIDPIPRYAAQRYEAFRWQDVERHFVLSRKQKKILALGHEAGLNHGIGIPLHGPRGEIAGISLATSEQQRSCPLNTDLLTAYCNQFYLAYRRLHKPAEPPAHNMILTRRERDILCWAAKGLPDCGIAERLNMSRHTVNMHLRRIYLKFGVENRIVAVAKALHHGLITF